MDRFGGDVAGGGQPETPIAVVSHIDAESAHQVERDVDIGFGNQLAFHLYFKCFSGQRQGHQQRGQKLAGNVAFDGYAADAVVLPFADVQRRVVFVAGVADVCADDAQGINQIADGAFVHARHAVQAVIAAQDCQRGGQRAEGGAGVAEE